MKALFGALLGLSLLAPAVAQVPGRPVNIVVPVGPGGGTDLLAREAAKRLAPSGVNRWWSKTAPVRPGWSARKA
jgi:tripartite-type tricarboxylate transporter receptor subunit TctC